MNTTIAAIKDRRTSTNALLLVVCLAQFMVILDVAVVNVALPSMRSGLHFSTAGLQWVVNAYTLTFAGFMMLGGRFADLLGRRRVFMAGTALFVLSSLACAIATSRGFLIGARALQGLGGAIVSPATLSIVTSSLREGRERNRGLGAWAAVGGLGASSGALLGGVLTQAFSWPAIFVINLPVGIVVLALALRVIPADIRSNAARHFDVTGAALVTAGLTGLTYGIVRSDALGWGSVGVLIPIIAGLALIAAFLLVEGRFARAPLVPLSIFRIGQLRAANLVVVLLYIGFFSMWFFITLYLQQILHNDALQTGLLFLPITLAIFATSTFTPRIVARFGIRPVVTVGMLLATVGMLLFTGIRPGGSYVAVVLPAGLVTAVGFGLALVSSTIAATKGVPATQSGLASGLLNMSRLFGGALGLAVLSTIAASSEHASAHVSAMQSLTNGYGVAFTVGATIAFLGAVIAAVFLREHPEVAPAPIVALGETQAEARAA